MDDLLQYPWITATSVPVLGVALVWRRSHTTMSVSPLTPRRRRTLACTLAVLAPLAFGATIAAVIALSGYESGYVDLASPVLLALICSAVARIVLAAGLRTVGVDRIAARSAARWWFASTVPFLLIETWLWIETSGRSAYGAPLCWLAIVWCARVRRAPSGVGVTNRHTIARPSGMCVPA